ncbi:hypothetical protein EBS02_06950, partial [bacterium]|nr:hypothetical protein [bacterium]
INNSSSNVILGVSQIFTRPLNNSYSSALNIPTINQNGTSVNLSSNINFMSDLLDFYKYNLIRDEEKASYLFYMKSPSQDNFFANYQIARQNYMFQLPFSYYDGFNNLTDSLKNNYLYANNLYSYKEFLARSFIDPDNITDPIEPSSRTALTRSGLTLTGSDKVNQLIRTSGAKDLVFKHFYLYCPENYHEICETILKSTGYESVFSLDSLATTSPNGDMNAESLLAEPYYTYNTYAHLRARDYIQNITDPYPKNLVPFRSQTQSGYTSYCPDTDNFEVIADNIIDKSYRSLSQYVLNEIKNRRVASTPPSSSSTSGSTDSISVLQFLDTMGTARILQSNDWLTTLNTTSTEGLLREIALIEASRLMLDYIHFRQNEHIEALLAAMVAQNQNLAQALNFNPNPTVATTNAINAATGTASF